ncbi:ABC-type multidrug transport system, ATPase and permease component [Streptomyces lincolnensis]|uniref:ABC-type multidrug transport system, ATPase and permease component n=1 Tax=Streptomyces lincolnensis TaxID=1915 RepID=A0A1B1MB81_STRLN|nr:ABC transporter ATP-binding protein [Streptomyces lincolnensis]ANS65896.1 ABC-type multidrug transport system, ATPase and permease component [Streptomyces lincolnensis]AXG54341.1 ABC-type multidrug transport system, ATPase and permease component [Streptomyces lincolnensis]QMV08719.1 ATP-binding cassette domain-containing protein [Streptomyces lincolnensis]
MISTLLRVLGHEYAGPVRRTVALMTVTALAEGLSYALLVPVLRALFGGTPEDAGPWLAAFGAAVAVYAVLRYVSDRSGFRVGTTMLHGMYERLGEHLARLPIGWYQPGRTGEVSVLASQGVLQAMGVIAHLLAPFISACVTPLTIVAVMLAFNWQLGLAGLAAVPLVAAVQLRTARATTATDAERVARERAATGRVIEYLQAQPVLRAGGRTGERFALLDDSLKELRRASRRSTMSALPGVLGLAVTVQAVFTALLALGAYLALGGDIGAAELLAVLVLAARCADPLLSLAEMSGGIRAARAELTRLDDVLNTEPLPEPRVPREPAGHDVTFDAVTFRHGDRTVADGVTLSVPEGRRLAVVGPSGAGKTTLLHLLARFYDVDAGAVRIGGVDVREMDPAALMARIAIVFQDVYLFDGTIEENVRLGRPDATDTEVRAAAAAARLDEVIERLPGGWSTDVGEGGTLLSGGERQRVSIARALLKNAPIVLLDEVTSALDPANEAAVHAGITQLMAGRTVLLVTHHMRTARQADQVAFLDAGRVVEQGSHEELLRRAGRYAAYWDLSLEGAARD